MGNLSEKQLFLTLIAVVVVVAGAFGVLAFLDYQKIQDKHAEVEDIRGQTKNLQSAIIKIPTLSRNVEDLRKRYDENQDKLPAEKFDIELIRGIKYQATNAEVDLVQFEIKPQPKLRRGKTTPYSEIEMSLKVRGSFFQVANFVNRLEHYPRILSFRKGDFRISGAGDKRDLIDFQGELVAFVQPPRKPGPKTPGRPEGPTRGKVWQSVDIPREKMIDSRLRDPFKMMLEEIAIEEAGGQKPTVAADEDAEKHIKEFKERLTKLKVDFKAGKDPRALLEAWEELKKDVDSVSFRRPKYRNVHLKIKREVDVLEKPIRQLYITYLLKLTKDVIYEMKIHSDHGDFRDALGLFIRLMSDFRSITIPQMIRSDIAQGGRIFIDVLARIIKHSDPKTVIWAVDELETAIKKTIRIPETEDILARAIEYREMARSIEEFRSFEILVSGIIWTPDAKRRIAIVNGKGYIEGDRISVSAKNQQESKEVRLATVGRNKYVHFQYKGLSIRVKLGKLEETAR